MKDNADKVPQNRLPRNNRIIISKYHPPRAQTNNRLATLKRHFDDGSCVGQSSLECKNSEIEPFPCNTAICPTIPFVSIPLKSLAPLRQRSNVSSSRFVNYRFHVPQSYSIKSSMHFGLRRFPLGLWYTLTHAVGYP